MVEKEIGQLTKELKDKDKDATERRIQDSLVTARMREELDYISNAKKEDKIIITDCLARLECQQLVMKRRDGSEK